MDSFLNQSYYHKPTLCAGSYRGRNQGLEVRWGSSEILAGLGRESSLGFGAAAGVVGCGGADLCGPERTRPTCMRPPGGAAPQCARALSKQGRMACASCEGLAPPLALRSPCAPCAPPCRGALRGPCGSWSRGALRAAARPIPAAARSGAVFGHSADFLDEADFAARRDRFQIIKRAALQARDHLCEDLSSISQVLSHALFGGHQLCEQSSSIVQRLFRGSR